jgi:sulfite exporter TauE/SafE
VIDTSAIGPTAAFVAGLAGSAHCFAMCGSVNAALALKDARGQQRRTHSLTLSATRQVARVAGYALAGAACGAAGGAVEIVLDLARVGAALRIVSGILLVLLAARLSLRWNAFARLEQLGARMWSALRPLASYGANASGMRQALILGFLWGWLPCGLVYAMLLYAVTSGSSIGGAAIMIAFGVGTLPSMLASSVFALELRRWLAQQWPRAASTALLLACGMWLIVVPLLPMHAHHHPL